MSESQNNPEITSAAYNRTRINDRNSLSELDLIGKINLRGDPSGESFVRGMEKAIGLALPQNCGEVSSNADKTVYWLGPDEWQLNCSLADVTTISDEISKQLDGIHHSHCEVSDYYTTLQLDGPDAAGIMARGCPLDLHSGVFLQDMAVQTRFGHASILLHKYNDTPSFHVQVRWSYTEYVWDYISSAMQALD